MSPRTRIIAAVVMLAVLAGGGLLASVRIFRPPAAYALVEQTTLVVLKGTVDLQRPNSPVTTVTADTQVGVGDRIRTGADAYAAVTYFDGSSTALEPNTEIILRELDRTPGGGRSISFQQEGGATWNRVEKLVDATIRFETTTRSAVVSAHGTEYIVRIGPGGETFVQSVIDSVTVEGAGVTLEVGAGFSSQVALRQPPTAPVQTPPPPLAVRVDVEGPALPSITDDVGRSMGFHAEVDAYLSQIPGATAILESNRASLYVPNPEAEYQVVLKPRDAGGSYTLRVTLFVEGRPVAIRSPGLAKTLDAELSGTISLRHLQGARFIQRDDQIELIGPLGERDGAPRGSRAAFARNQIGSVSRLGSPPATPSGTLVVTRGPSASPSGTPSPTPPSSSSALTDISPSLPIPAPDLQAGDGVPASTSTPTPVAANPLPSTLAPSVAPTSPASTAPSTTLTVGVPTASAPPTATSSIVPTEPLIAIRTELPSATLVPTEVASTAAPTETMTPRPTETSVPPGDAAPSPTSTRSVGSSGRSSSSNAALPTVPLTATGTTTRSATMLTPVLGTNVAALVAPSQTPSTIPTVTSSLTTVPSPSTTTAPTSSISPTVVANITVTLRPSDTPTSSPTFTPSSTPTSTVTLTPTHTPTLTRTPTLTLAPSPSGTSTPTTTASVTVTSTPVLPALTVSKRAVPDPALVGALVTYSITVLNVGGSPSDPQAVVDPVPAATTPRDVSAGCMIVSGAVNCTTDVLFSGQRQVFVFTALVERVPTEGENGTCPVNQLENTVTIRAASGQPNSVNSTAIVCTRVLSSTPTLTATETNVATATPAPTSTLTPTLLSTATRTPTATPTSTSTPTPGNCVVQSPAISGSPLATSYEVRDDSDANNGPTFGWIDLSSSGTPIASLASVDNACAGPIALPFGFPFFGETFDAIYVNSNGLLSFVDGSSTPVNGPLPSSSPPNLYIAPYWDDLGSTCHVNDGVFYQAFGQGPNQTFVFEWLNWDHATCTTENFTFEAILNVNGQIVFQYLTLGGSEPNVGVENQDGTVGASYFGATNGRAVRFSPFSTGP